ncbi:hypothetical protein ACFC3F_12420 [Microbacterium sp. NPDC055910]|uniref:hypothetical protein n=1 Tax=Microbacterium sp. NPDC055910 TaxID=3345659 RepID=UPI0035D83B1B
MTDVHPHLARGGDRHRPYAAAAGGAPFAADELARIDALAAGGQRDLRQKAEDT